MIAHGNISLAPFKDSFACMSFLISQQLILAHYTMHKVNREMGSQNEKHRVIFRGTFLEDDL